VNPKGVSFVPRARNRKLAPVVEIRLPNGRSRFQAIGPYCACTYVSIQQTCQDSCAFKDGNGCFAEAGYTGPLVRVLDESSLGMRPIGVALAEAQAIDALKRIPADGGKYGTTGRDLRLHISGDAYDVESARVLASAARRWVQRGGGTVWAYTHSWRVIPVEAWDPIQVLASCETPQGVAEAREMGYATALVVSDHRGATRAYTVPEIAGKILPCPAETVGTTCVQCRLCLNADGLRRRTLTIGFSAHGRDVTKAKRVLPMLGTLFGNIP
jgi:hypothetical protein